VALARGRAVMQKKPALKWLIVLSVICLVFALVGCASNADFEIIATSISEPSQLPDTLAHQKILFNAREGLTHITSLDRQEVASLKILGNYLVISQDGQYLTYSGSLWTQIHIVDLKTGEDRIVIDADTLGVRSMHYPSFSPDGQRLLFRVDISDTESDLGLVDIDGGSYQIIRAEGLNSSPQYSPDEKHILSICEGKDVVGFQICIMGADGTNRQRLTRLKAYHDAWFTPDGRKIVFTRLETALFQKDKAGLYTMNLNGTDVKLLLDWYVAVLAFSVDDRSVVFCKIPEEGGCEGIYVIDLDGKNLQHLTYFDKEFLAQWK
jgi:Tol biopolymer transport system component